MKKILPIIILAVLLGVAARLILPVPAPREIPLQPGELRIHFLDVGRAAVVEEFGVSRVLDAGYPHGSRFYRGVLSRIESRKIDYKLAEEYRSPQVSTAVAFEIVWPPEG